LCAATLNGSNDLFFGSLLQLRILKR